MISLQHALRRRPSLFLFVACISLMLKSTSAYAQYSNQSVCVSGTVVYEDSGSDGGYSDDIEQTVCLSYDSQSGLDSYVETDNDYSSSFSGEYGTDNLWTYGVGAEAQLIGFDANNNAYTVADSGMVYSATDDSGSQSAYAEINSTPQQYLTYELNGFYSECESGSNYWDCTWQSSPYTGSNTGVSLSLTLTLPTSTTVATSATPTTAGQPVTFTATTTSGATGQVAFYVCCNASGSIFSDPWGYTPVGTVSGTTASYTATWIPAGTYSVTAYYLGDTTYSSSQSSPISQNIQAVAPTIATTTTISIAPSGTYVGNPVVANIAVTSTTGEVPTGTVTCNLSGTSPQYSSSLVNGKTTWTIPGQQAGMYSVNCNYGGSATFIGGSAPQLSLPVATVPQPTWTQEGSLPKTLFGHTATLLPNGTVLIAGGNYVGSGDQWETNDAELYTPGANGTGSFASTGSMFDERFYHTATLLTAGPYSGQVLIVGGENYYGTTLAEAELFNPSTSTNGTFSPSPGNPNYARSGHTATSLQDGSVLIAGGSTSCVGCGSWNQPVAEVYIPQAGTFKTVGSLNTPRGGHTATLLQNGMVLIAGGVDSNDNISASAELYNPSTQTFAATGSLNTARYQPTATLLPDGTVLIAGGMNSSGGSIGTAESYNPSSGTFQTMTSPLNVARYAAQAVLLSSGNVLISGGLTNGSVPNTTSSELYNPLTQTFTATTSMNTARYSQTMTVLADGSVLTTGGIQGPGQFAPVITSSAEVYSPNNTITGVINPKYLVIGLTYAPPGPNSYVTYQNSNYVGSTSTFSSQFGTAQQIKVAVGGQVSGWLGGVLGTSAMLTATTTTGYTQSNLYSNTVTITGQTSNLWKTAGTLNAFAPVNHDFDLIWVWLNPLLELTVDPNQPSALPVWNGYAYNMDDQDSTTYPGPQGLDVWPVAVGCLNGDFTSNGQTDCTETFNKLARRWDTQDYFPNGDVPALTQADYAQILSFDPFVQGYTLSLNSSSPATTLDGRYTQATTAPSGSSTGGSPENMLYIQPSGGGTPPVQTYTTTYSNSSVASHTAQNITTQSFSLEDKFSGTFFGSKVMEDISLTSTLTWTNSATTSITNTQTEADAANIQGPPCNAPLCTPTYTGIAPNQPSNFDVYQDNMFGTFMFYGTN